MRLLIQLKVFRRNTILALLVAIFTVFIVETEGSTSLSRLPGQVTVNAGEGGDGASALELCLRSSVLWQAHVPSRQEVKERVKQLVNDFKQLGELRASGTSRQPDTVERIDPPVQSMAVDLARLLFVAVIAGLLCAAVNMSDRKNATVTIPFAFSANHQIVPAGCYKVRLVSDRILSLVNIQTGVQLRFQMVPPEPAGSVETRGRLVFRMDGGRHVLTEVRIAGSRVRNKLFVQSSLDHEPAKRSPPEGAFTEIAMD